jgi:F1F0 ATPase subunit 2
MSEPLTLMLALVTGVGLGAMFFGGLWWTVQRAVSARQPALWFLGSLLLRTGTTLAGFWVVGHGHWQRLLLCLVGFVMARPVVMWLTRSPGKARARPEQEAVHAP